MSAQMPPSYDESRYEDISWGTKRQCVRCLEGSSIWS